MSDSDREISRPQAASRNEERGAIGRVRPRLGVLDLLLQLWRARLLMFLIFFGLTLAGLAITQIFPAKAVATAKVLVSTPPDISVTTSSDRPARIIIQPGGAHLEVEKQRAMAPENAAGAIARVGVERLYPDPAVLGRAPGDGVADDLERRFFADLTITPDAASSVLEIRFAHPNGSVAVDALDEFVEAYLSRRSPAQEEAIVPGEKPAPASLDERLRGANDAILAFLDANAIGDFASEIETVNGTLETISRSLVGVRASLSEARGRAGELEGQLEATPAEIELFVETVTTNRTSALEMERARMLARYGSDHPVIQELDSQIAIARQSPATNLESARTRTGPNPIRQTLAAGRSDARAQAAALEQRAAALARQRTEAGTRRRALAALEPEWRRLVRVRDQLEGEAAGEPNRRRTPAELHRASGAGAAAVSLLEPARLAGRGVSPTRAVAAIFVGLGLISALAAGLLRGWLSRGLPTPAAAERTLGLRVLAAVGDR